MILSGQTIRRLGIIDPCCERTAAFGLTYGVGPNGYDIRVRESIRLHPGSFVLASSVERFTMPCDAMGIVHDKSTWARRGLAVQNTVLEAGWYGFLTLELSNHGRTTLCMEPGTPIAQVIFHRLDEVAEQPYTGRYQDAPEGPQNAILIPEEYSENEYMERS